MKELNGVKLAGTYDFDDEGDPAQRVDAVDNGVLKNFLMSRMPITDFSHSNGHGRRQPGLMPTGRQGNLIVTSTNTVKDADLRQKFIDEIKKQGKPYGLYFDDIQGGFTLTTRALPQAFQVLPVMVYRVYADGRPDELVRGVDIVGTPLLSLNNIMVTGDTEQVFNGVCGAESGQVPVAAAAPAMLFSEIEVQKRRKGTRASSDSSGPRIGNRRIIFRCEVRTRRGEKPMSKHSRTTSRTARQSGPHRFLTATTFAVRNSAYAQQTASRHVRSPRSLPSKKPTASDPILQAMHEELARSKDKLKMDNVPAPYYIEYRLSDVEEFDAEAAYGALREKQRVHSRILRVVVRVGDYKQDSFYGPGLRCRGLGASR